MGLLGEIVHGIHEYEGHKREEIFDMGYQKGKRESEAEIAELHSRIEHLRGGEGAKEKIREEFKAELIPAITEIREHIRAVHEILKNKFGV